MMNYLNDVTFWLYIASIVASAWGFGLFSWWGQKTWRTVGERPSSVFICLWILFFGGMVDSSISAYMRSQVVGLGYSQAYSFFRSWAWTIRVLPVLIAMIAIDIEMSYRILFHKTAFKKNGHKAYQIKGGKIDHIHLKDAEPVELKISGKRVEVAILRKATNEVAIILDAIITEVEP